MLTRVFYPYFRTVGLVEIQQVYRLVKKAYAYALSRKLP